MPADAGRRDFLLRRRFDRTALMGRRSRIMKISQGQRSTFIAIPAAPPDAPAATLGIVRNESGASRTFLTVPVEKLDKLLELSGAHSPLLVQRILDSWRDRHPVLTAVVPVLAWLDTRPTSELPIEGVVALSMLRHRRLPVVADAQSAAWLRGSLGARDGLPAGWQVYSTQYLHSLIAAPR